MMMLLFASPMIPQKMIELDSGLRKIVVAATIHDVDVFTCVGVIEPETVSGNGKNPRQRSDHPLRTRLQVSKQSRLN